MSCPECDRIKDELFRSRLDTLDILGDLSRCLDAMTSVTYEHRGDALRIAALADELMEKQGPRIDKT